MFLAGQVPESRDSQHIVVAGEHWLALHQKSGLGTIPITEAPRFLDPT